VARAYRELEGAGLVASRRRVGTVVTAPSMPAAASSDVRQAAAELASRAHQAGMSEETALSLLRAALVALRA
jgi:GntR family transcriptional regulator